jgi:hypothetical protein
MRPNYLKFSKHLSEIQAKLYLQCSSSAGITIADRRGSQLKATAHNWCAILSTAFILMAVLVASTDAVEFSPHAGRSIATNQGLQVYPYAPTPPVLSGFKDVVNIAAEDEDGIMVAHTADTREFQGETVPHTSSANDRPDDTVISIILPSDAYDVQTAVDGQTTILARAGGLSAAEGYDAFELSVPWGGNAVWQENHYEIHPYIELGYLSALNKTENGYILRYCLVPMKNQDLDLQIKLPLGSEVLRTSPEMNATQASSGIYLKMPPLGIRENQTLIEILVEFSLNQ